MPKPLSALIALIALVALLFVRYQYGSYLLFHGLVELFTVVVAVSVFVIAWNARRYITNNYVLFIGIAFLFVGMLTGLHMLSYKGMPILQERGADLATQLWIATQYATSLAFLVAPLFITRKIKSLWLILAWTTVTSALLAAIYWGIFPECFNPETGLTPFKKISEYVISAFFLTAIFLLTRNRRHFEANVLVMLIMALFVMTAGEIAFTLYKDVYGLANLTGHVCRLAAFYLIYKVLIETGLKKPYDLLFRELKQNEFALRDMNEELARRVEEKTADLSKTIRILNGQIAERRQAEQTLLLYSRRLEVLHQVDKSILTAESLDALSSATLERVKDLVPCWWVSITLFDAPKEMARVLHIVGSPDVILVAGDFVPQSALGIDDLKQEKIRLVPDMQAIPDDAGYVHPMKSRGLRAYLNVPLIAGGELIGSLNFGSDKPDAFLPDHLEIAREVADQLAVAIQHTRLHEQVKRHAEELEQRVTERTAELEAFTYSVSHDLRSPLRAINGFASLLKRRVKDSLGTDSLDLLQQIVSASLQMGRLIEDLLRYSRLGHQAIVHKPVQLSDVLEEVLQILSERSQKLNADISIANNLPAVLGDPTLLFQVVANLFENALTYRKDGIPPSISVSAETQDHHAILRIADNGIGMPAQSLDRIFEPFHRLNSGDKYPGSGIGLAIVKKSINLMNGQISVESTEGEGSTFHIRLPLAQ